MGGLVEPRSVNEEARAVREQSIRLAAEMGYLVNSELPLLENTEVCRLPQEVAGRCLVLHACCAASYGFSRRRAIDWLSHSNLFEQATAAEQEFLRTGVDGERFRTQPESVWVLSWMLMRTKGFVLKAPMPQSAVDQMPDLESLGAADGWLDGSKRLRTKLDGLGALDFYYCVHWALREAHIRREVAPSKLPYYAVVHRRRSLEWCFTTTAWDDVSLDT